MRISPKVLGLGLTCAGATSATRTSAPFLATAVVEALSDINPSLDEQG